MDTLNRARWARELEALGNYQAAAVLLHRDMSVASSATADLEVAAREAEAAGD
jgi:hypothetical protein